MNLEGFPEQKIARQSNTGLLKLSEIQILRGRLQLEKLSVELLRQVTKISVRLAKERARLLIYGLSMVISTRATET